MDVLANAITCERRWGEAHRWCECVSPGDGGILYQPPIATLCGLSLAVIMASCRRLSMSSIDLGRVPAGTLRV